MTTIGLYSAARTAGNDDEVGVVAPGLAGLPGEHVGRAGTEVGQFGEVDDDGAQTGTQAVDE
ncbi:hypothetical protein GCM10009533_19730 [Saccharopolyspora spinosporotrichia]|uniref:Uncharacterized protein n=1 Tax=Saccharopolyspora erythraea TaxID=1836 RepID=A0ABN1CLL1_SACER|nr:hypothetical protein [Saccharopolyspora erythraea]EQD82377.1 hypothetical protein N599_30965 [Saccharopolyspora erythraea D]